LGTDKGTAKYYSRRYEALGAALGRNGHPSILSEEHREDFVRQIKETYHHGILWTIVEILQSLQERAAETVDKNSVYRWLNREARIKSCCGVPMEDRRLEVAPEAIADDFQRPIDMIDGPCTRFILLLKKGGIRNGARDTSKNASPRHSTEEIKSVIRSRG
jgi:hypothetical protein